MTTQVTGTPVKEWARANQPSNELFWAKGYWEQISFISQVVPRILTTDHSDRESIRSGITVISTHLSKSVRLPVFRLVLPDGTIVILRYNFYDWKVSVSSPRDIEANFMGLFNPNEQIDPVYCEGFPEELVYGPHALNRRQFTFELPPGTNHLFTFFWLFTHQVLLASR
ncbi:MAG TPA: hypothetical protein VLF67_00670 [Candidatus Saccharimonas sp.]|nr:hypothetical protein [Candidatus Saccharimonas sp.]